jgi:hypothetical protein
MTAQIRAIFPPRCETRTIMWAMGKQIDDAGEKPSDWLWLYILAAVLTLAFQIWIRSAQCAGIEGCGLSFAKAIIWSVIWPVCWVVYLAGLISGGF